MIGRNISLIRLYLPLLAHPQTDVRQQAYVILTSAYGVEIIGQLRALLLDNDRQIRQQTRLALQTFIDCGESDVAIAPLQGIEISCVGPLRVTINGRTLTQADWVKNDSGRAGWQKVHSVFAFLVHCGRRGATRQAIGEAVWGNNASLSSISRTLSSLRMILTEVGETFAQGALIINPTHCLLDPAYYDCDVDRFERCYQIATETEDAEDLAAAQPLYAQVMDLYSGPYMMDVLRGSGWMIERRDRFTSLYLNAIERLAELAYTKGEYQYCVALCQQALDTDLTADDVTAWLLQSYDRLGYTAEFEHTYYRYLRIAQVDPESASGKHDNVVMAYAGIRKTLALGK